MKESRTIDFLASVSYLNCSWRKIVFIALENLNHFTSLFWQLNALQFRRMDFEEFCAATLSVRQLEDLGHWEQLARSAYEAFEKDGNRAIMIEELASVRSINQSRI